jgi:Fe-S-cluster containining protein
MDEQFDEVTDSTPDVEQGNAPGEAEYACFRCGECCRLWVFVNYKEADRIAEYVKLPRKEFTIEYWDRDVSTEECLVLDQKDDACVFLREKADTREKYCGIYEIRPQVCREYVPSLMRKECQSGLTKYWNLKATPTGKLEGSGDDIRVFFDYLKKMVFGSA